MSRKSSISGGGRRLRSNGKGSLLEEDAKSSPSSSITVDEEPQPLRQSSGGGGGGGGVLVRRFAVTGGELAISGCDGRGPLDDTTVLLRLLEVGLCGPTSRYSPRRSRAPLLPDVLGSTNVARRSRQVAGEKLDGETGKLVLALAPRSATAAASKARAASSGEPKVPSRTSLFVPGSLISAVYLPTDFRRTPLYLGSACGAGTCTGGDAVSAASLLAAAAAAAHLPRLMTAPPRVGRRK